MATPTLLKVTNYKSSPVEVPLRAGIDGALANQDWIDALIARGYGWHVSVGTFTTPVLGGGAGTALLGNEPELVIDIPAGKTLVPLRFEISLETPLIAADDNEVESLIAVDQGAISDANAGNGTVELQWNMRTGAAGLAAGGGVNVVSAITSNLSGTPALDLELSHKTQVADVQGTAANALWGDFMHVYEPKWPPLITGLATLVVYFGGTVATSGYISADYLVFDTAKIDDFT